MFFIKLIKWIIFLFHQIFQEYRQKFPSNKILSFLSDLSLWHDRDNTGTVIKIQLAEYTRICKIENFFSRPKANFFLYNTDIFCWTFQLSWIFCDILQHLWQSVRKSSFSLRRYSIILIPIAKTGRSFLHTSLKPC